MKKIYTEEQRNEILQRYRSGEKVASICEDTGIAKSTIYERTKSNNKKKNKEVNMSDFRILRQRCETLEKMVEVLQKSATKPTRSVACNHVNAVNVIRLRRYGINPKEIHLR